jgi:phospho-N-acetylmuramoyl-pentapeptide-transferase
MSYFIPTKEWVLRGIFVLLLSFTFCWAFIPLLIKYAAKHKLAHVIRVHGPATHLQKFGTPNMGGIVIVGSIIASTFLFCSLSSAQYWSILVGLLGFAALGLYDDITKIYGVKGRGLSARQKMLFQILISYACCLILRYCSERYTTVCNLPFTHYLLDLGHFYDLFCVFVICSASNSVNLTDGLDGLAIVPISITAASFIFLAMCCPSWSVHLELIFVCLGIIGSGLGFLIYNKHPAKIFMGDTGSLSLGGLLGIISVITHNQFFLAIIGGVFVIETVSVILQVSYFKISKGKRIFKMAPIHHHFEQLGISETKIVKGFWIASLLFAALGLSGRLLAIA